MVSPRFSKPRPSQPGQGDRAGPVLRTAGRPETVVIGMDARPGREAGVASQRRGRQWLELVGRGLSSALPSSLGNRCVVPAGMLGGWAGAGRLGAGECQDWGGKSRGCPSPVSTPRRETCLLGDQVVMGYCSACLPCGFLICEAGTLSWRPGKGTGMSVSSVALSCPTLCDPMDCSTPGLLVHHQLPEFTQTHVH